MSKTFATSIYEEFEKNGALKMRAENFLTVLRRAGATISREEGKKLVRFLGIDPEGCVDVRKFSAWFEGIEQEPRFKRCVPSLLAASTSQSNDGEPRFSSENGP
eukprot:TRINITY_DN12436_c0_g1_i1.p2 TRINITY_DN12436_c0_g1~~TRINITY_DN12436_c0_g1_i1.p2  ORF type:complete len:104 (+),score=21.97 TRINITY_DN12436_c0_g1_i1:55-366(+)